MINLTASYILIFECIFPNPIRSYSCHMCSHAASTARDLEAHLMTHPEQQYFLELQKKTGTNCIKIGLPGKSILGDYFQENRTSRRESVFREDLSLYNWSLQSALKSTSMCARQNRRTRPHVFAGKFGDLRRGVRNVSLPDFTSHRYVQDEMVKVQSNSDEMTLLDQRHLWRK